jgi:hypothetical protein
MEQHANTPASSNSRRTRRHAHREAPSRSASLWLLDLARKCHRSTLGRLVAPAGSPHRAGRAIGSQPRDSALLHPATRLRSANSWEPGPPGAGEAGTGRSLGPARLTGSPPPRGQHRFQSCAHLPPSSHPDRQVPPVPARSRLTTAFRVRRAYGKGRPTHPCASRDLWPGCESIQYQSPGAGPPWPDRQDQVVEAVLQPMAPDDPFSDPAARPSRPNDNPILAQSSESLPHKQSYHRKHESQHFPRLRREQRPHSQMAPDIAYATLHCDR